MNYVGCKKLSFLNEAGNGKFGMTSLFSSGIAYFETKNTKIVYKPFNQDGNLSGVQTHSKSFSTEDAERFLGFLFEQRLRDEDYLS